MNWPNHFFVTGLGRCRTNWLANFFTHGESFCYHDLFAKTIGTSARYPHALAECGRRYIGDSDAGLCMVGKSMVDIFPESKWIIVQRDLEQTIESFYRYFNEHPYPQFGPPMMGGTRLVMQTIWGELQELIELIPSHRKMVVTFDDLNQEDVGRKLWEFIVPTEPFDALRWRLLNQMRINPVSERIALAGVKAGLTKELLCLQ